MHKKVRRPNLITSMATTGGVRVEGNLPEGQKSKKVT